MDMIASERRGVAVEPRLNIKMPRNPQMRKAKHARNSVGTSSSRNAQRHYERYLALARAEALKGDRIAAENYFQHADHYLRLMRDDGAAASSGGRS
ncbi:DUF4167 domain-containing protein [Bradyrhizobium hipponense]|uniref:DUF4167 domain-containing protein n=1 Tax=Bradyrhizobium hipponense TaxID=2605638 RepID=A0A5S4YTR4_9BRAD|nr:DUF4167 domain-containing protein [Bradyrhizobium hipponense]TYO67781.1 DUF4167 domain-containing protein [Bradyrhizobium hipponense]